MNGHTPPPDADDLFDTHDNDNDDGLGNNDDNDDGNDDNDDVLLDVPIVAPPASRKRTASGRVNKSTRRRAPALRPGVQVLRDANGARLDPVLGGTLADGVRSRLSSRHVADAKPLTDFVDDLRATTLSIDQAAVVTDPDVATRVLAGGGRVLLHHVITPDVLAMQYDMAMHCAGDPDRCDGDFSYALANLPRLVGKAVLLFGKLPGIGTPPDAAAAKRKLKAQEAKLAPPGSGANEYALHPVFVSVKSEYANDQGGIMYQGVVLSAMAFNHPVGHAARLRTGLSDEFDDTCAVLLVTGTYAMRRGGAAFNSIAWSAINPKRMSAGQIDPLNRDGRNLHDDTFQWDAYVRAHPDDTSASKFALTESKQVKGLLRRLLPPAMTLDDARDVLAGLRARGELEAELVRRPATLAGQRGGSRRDVSQLVGNDLRKCLLAEMLLHGTALCGAMTGSAADVALPAMPDLGTFVTDVREFLAGRAGADRPAPVPYQTEYDAFYAGVE